MNFKYSSVCFNFSSAEPWTHGNFTEFFRCNKVISRVFERLKWRKFLIDNFQDRWRKGIFFAFLIIWYFRGFLWQQLIGLFKSIVKLKCFSLQKTLMRCILKFLRQNDILIDQKGRQLFKFMHFSKFNTLVKRHSLIQSKKLFNSSSNHHILKAIWYAKPRFKSNKKLDSFKVKSDSNSISLNESPKK